MGTGDPDAPAISDALFDVLEKCRVCRGIPIDRVGARSQSPHRVCTSKIHENLKGKRRAPLKPNMPGGINIDKYLNKYYVNNN